MDPGKSTTQKKTTKRNRCVVSPPVEWKLCLRKTHPPDFWYSKRCLQYLLLYHKSSAWFVCRRRYDYFTMDLPDILQKATWLYQKRKKTAKNSKFAFSVQRGVYTENDTFFAINVGAVAISLACIVVCTRIRKKYSFYSYFFRKF